MSISFPFRLTALALATVTLPVAAQVVPDAGRVLQEQTAPALPPPKSAEGVLIVVPPNEPTPSGGATVTLASVRFVGNSLLSDAQLKAALGKVAGQSFDLAGLRGLADRISNVFTKAGYPFARAFLPAQELSNGQLTIEVVEGRYGEVRTTGDATLAAQAQRFLSALKPGAPIESVLLERSTLILDDQPGIKVSPVIRPGQSFGTGDLDIGVQRTHSVKGDVGYDNQGNRYTGEHRLHANVQFDSPFRLGDQVLVRGLYSDEGLWLGSLTYGTPVGVDGWRASVGYTHTYYLLGKDFANLESSGTADVVTAGASYPLVRSQALNLTIGANLQHKDLKDIKGAAGTQATKSSDAVPVTLQFDRRDGFAGDGIVYGALTFTPGRLNLGDEATDRSSGLNSRGSFDKWNLDLARIQSVRGTGVSLFGRVSAQYASKNLDSSERFSLGGPAGVRAYPVGEGICDNGWLAQVELRYQAGAFSPYAFYDAGAVRINAKQESLNPAPATNERSIGGGGVGTRFQKDAWSADLAIAWRAQGGAPQADTLVRSARVWLTASYQF